jgi:erythritol kinase
MEEMIKDVPIGAHGVMYHPYLLAGGERAPFTDSRARASYTGLSVKTSLADIVRATYEGVAFAMLDCYEHMPLTPEQITVCGGGSGSNTWCQMFADALGSRIVTVKGDELGARGVAINNMVVQGIYGSYQEAVSKIVKTKMVYEPNMEHHKKYMKFYELYKELYTSIQKTWKTRATILKE